MKEQKRWEVPNEALMAAVGEDLRQGRSVKIVVRGNSMNPVWVDRRDKVVLSPCTDADLRPGVVVLARVTDGRFILHRIVRREGDVITLRGDGNVRGTEQTCPAQVMAVVTSFERKGRMHSCRGAGWRCYSRLWRWTTPCRRVLLAVWRRCGKRN